MNILKGILTHAWGCLNASFGIVWSKLSHLLLPLVLILVFLAVGLWVAEFIGDQIEKLVKKSKVDEMLDRILGPTLKFTGTRVNSSSLISGSIRWFLMAIVLIAALDLAGMTKVIDFVKQAVAYVPNLFIAALIIAVGALIANLAAYVVSLVVKNGSMTTIARVAINTLAFIAALNQFAVPLANSFSQFIGHLNLSRLQGDVLFVGIIVLVLLGSKSFITKTVENILKS